MDGGREGENDSSDGKRWKVRDCGRSTRATYREPATARARSDSANWSGYYRHSSRADGIRSKRAVDWSRPANSCSRSLEWKPEHSFERGQWSRGGETLEPKGK